MLTRLRDVIPKGRVELVLRLHDFRKQTSLGFFIERRISTETVKIQKINELKFPAGGAIYLKDLHCVLCMWR